MKSKKALISVIAVIAILIGPIILEHWWESSTLVTFQELAPTNSSGVLSISGKRLYVAKAGYKRGSKKMLIITLGPQATLTEEDNRVYAPQPLICDEQAQANCHLLQDHMGRPLRVEVTSPVTNLPPTGQVIEAIIGNTRLKLVYESDNLLSDSEITAFFDSLQPTHFSSVAIDRH